MYYSLSSAQADVIRLGANAAMQAEAFSTLIVVKFDALPASGTSFTIFQSGSAADQSYQASNGSFQFRVGDAGDLQVIKDNTVAVYSGPAGVIAPGKWTVVSLAFASGAPGYLRLAVNGRVVGQHTPSIDSFKAGNFTIGTKDGTTSEKGPVDVALFGYWPRTQAEHEQIALSRNPWQMFQASLEEDAVAPVVATIAPSAASLVITGFAPTVARGVTTNVVPGATGLALTGFAPSVTQGMTTGVSPAPVALTLAGYAPAVTQTAARGANPAPATLTITGYAPTVARGASLAVAGGAPAAMTLTGYAPTVTQANNLVPHYHDATIMRLSGVRGVANLGPDRLQQTAGLP